jgi:hypothetical protein
LLRQEAPEWASVAPVAGVAGHLWDTADPASGGSRERSFGFDTVSGD